MPCPDNNSYSCGDNKTGFSVYKSITPTTSLMTTSTLLAITSTTSFTSSFTYYSCYSNNTMCGSLPGNSRVYTSYTDISSCQKFCSNYTYFGIQTW